MAINIDGCDRKPVIKTLSSGKQMAGFMNLCTKEFEGIMEIQDPRELDKFLEDYEISVAEVIRA